ncbi:branched-chain amino acid transaminase [Candidatus Gracilibacteria bacterium]|nr:branched-chain amino acid transaminase [Candidatus Gracilibacteria bacterium]
MPNNRFAFFNGEIVPIEQATVSVMTNALNYGTGCFEGIRGYWNADEQQLFVFQLRAHMERLHRSCKILFMQLPYTVDQLCQITIDLLRKEEFREDVYIRPLVYKSDPAIAVRLNDMNDAFTLFAVGFGQYIDKSALKVCVSSWRRIEDNIIPSRAKVSGAYVNSALAKTEALLNGFDEAIVLGGDGQVAEASAANLFIVRDNILVTPPITGDILEGITRKVVVDLAQNELGLNVVERAIDRTELYIADEAFFCGTGAEIKPIVEIDRRIVGDAQVGPIGSKLVQLYADMVRGRSERYREWCTPVY